MSFAMRRYKTGDCKGWLKFSRNYTCDDPVVYEGFCEAHIPYDLKRKREYDATPLATRQTYLDALKAGKNIGQAREVAGISLEVAIEITNRAIKAYQYLDFEAQP